MPGPKQKPAPPAGPWHPPIGQEIRCTKNDSCPVLLDKIEAWIHMIVSHYMWDAANGTNRHQIPPPNGAPSDIDQMWNGYNNCLAIYTRKCKGDCEKQRNPQPAPSPSPSPAPGPFPFPFMPFSPFGPGPRLFPEPIPEPLPDPIPIEPIPIPFF